MFQGDEGDPSYLLWTHNLSTNGVELSACQRGVTPGGFSLNCRDYRQYQDFQTRKLLSLVASELAMWLDNQQPDRV
ncbi:Hypp4368 [Branchiostoma lanceolatum]|uniref:Hypp4368 protein n=1 Tax=Branchiostoma lanceolatum TaxID=7740 RepID=A0A8K0F1L3_BRALA|nr:Hypp4368 [Branchiostoma lanceolatum]